MIVGKVHPEGVPISHGFEVLSQPDGHTDGDLYEEWLYMLQVCYPLK